MTKKTAKKKTTKKKEFSHKSSVDDLIQKEAKGETYGQMDDNVDIISTGSYRLDKVLGGGFARGWSKWRGDFESGKTSMALNWAAQWQNFYGDDAFVFHFDTEGRVTKERRDASNIDSSPDRYRCELLNTAETVMDVIRKFVLDNPFKKKYFFIIDSSDGMIRKDDKPKAFAGKDTPKIGGGAVLSSMFGRNMSLPMVVGGHHLFICSQVRDQINTNSRKSGKGLGGGNMGRAVGFYSSLMGELRSSWSNLKIKKGKEKEAEEIGHYCNILLEKTPNEQTGKQVLVPIKKGLKGGIWVAREAFDVAEEMGLLSGSSWISMNELLVDQIKSKYPDFEPKLKLQGVNQWVEYLESTPQVVQSIFDYANSFNSALEELKSNTTNEMEGIEW